MNEIGDIFKIADELSEIASKMNFTELEQLMGNAEKVGKSWCGSCLGYHSRVYYKDLQPVPPGARFSKEWGFMHKSSYSKGEWVEYSFDDVINDIYSMAGFGLLGNPLFSIVSRNETLMFKTERFIEKKLDPRFLMADFQLTYWPLDMLQRQFENSGVEIIKKNSPDYGRLIYFRDKKIIDISYQYATPWKGKVVFKHLERNYILSVTTHSFEPL